jgi:hypothetical protein
MFDKHMYVVKPTGADSPSQNVGTEKWNDILAVTTRALLYGTNLPAPYWSAALTYFVAQYEHHSNLGIVGLHTCNTSVSWDPEFVSSAPAIDLQTLTDTLWHLYWVYCHECKHQIHRYHQWLG